MASKDTGGRPAAEKLPKYLWEFIKNYVISPVDSSSPKTASETKFLFLSRLIDERLRDYLSSQARRLQIAHLLQSRLSEQEMEAFIQGSYRKELISAKTLKRCYDKEIATQATKDILEAFYITEQEAAEYRARFDQGIRRVAGLYYAYARHSSNLSMFQEFMIKIDLQGRCFMKYMPRTIHTIELSTEIVENKGLLLRHEARDFVLIFYVYIGEETSPNFLQGIHLYPTRAGNPVANLVVFQRIKTRNKDDSERQLTEKEQEVRFDAFMPSYEKSMLNPDEAALEQPVKETFNLTIRENIQRFLCHKITPFTTELHGEMPFDFARKPAIFPAYPTGKADFYEIQQEYVGNYKLYFNERYPSIKHADGRSPRNDSFSSVGMANLTIKTDKIHGQLTCRMALRKNAKMDKMLIYSGHVVNQHLKDPSLMIVTLYLEHSSRCYLQMLFMLVDENILTGCFTTAYSITPSSKDKLGSGIVVAVRNDLPDSMAIPDLLQGEKPHAVIASQYAAKQPFEQRIINYLSKNAHALMVPPDLAMLKAYADTRYWGVYRLYFKTQKDAVSIRTLIIYRNKHIALRSPHHQSEVALGECEETHDILTIILRHTDKTGKKGTSYGCIQIDEATPREKTHAFYGGSFNGYSLDDTQEIVATLIVLEYIKTGDDPAGDWQELLLQLDEKNRQQQDIPEKVEAFFEEQTTVLQNPFSIFSQ